ncbi:MAG: hypothetical protein F4056_09335 [Chloroflexi bacterium]|nr:hypothetical protein [Chloroflexota bacterium]
MRCAVVEVRLDLESDIAFPTPSEVVREVVGRAGSEALAPPNVPTLVPSAQVRVPAKRLGVLASGHSWSVRSEHLTDVESMFQDVVEQFRLAAGFYAEVAARSVTVSSHWIEPLDMRWSDVVRAYVGAFYRSETLPPEASDATVVFDVARDDGEDTYQSGPMEKNQLVREYLNFWDADEPGLPEVLFFFAHRALIRSDASMDPSTLEETSRGALDRAISFAENHYAQFARRIGAPS